MEILRFWVLQSCQSASAVHRAQSSGCRLGPPLEVPRSASHARIGFQEGAAPKRE